MNRQDGAVEHRTPRARRLAAVYDFWGVDHELDRTLPLNDGEEVALSGAVLARAPWRGRRVAFLRLSDERLCIVRHYNVRRDQALEVPAGALLEVREWQVGRTPSAHRHSRRGSRPPWLDGASPRVATAQDGPRRARRASRRLARHPSTDLSNRANPHIAISLAQGCYAGASGGQNESSLVPAVCVPVVGSSSIISVPPRLSHEHTMAAADDCSTRRSSTARRGVRQAMPSVPTATMSISRTSRSRGGHSVPTTCQT